GLPARELRRDPERCLHAAGGGERGQDGGGPRGSGNSLSKRDLPVRRERARTHPWPSRGRREDARAPRHRPPPRRPHRRLARRRSHRRSRERDRARRIERGLRAHLPRASDALRGAQGGGARRRQASDPPLARAKSSSLPRAVISIPSRRSTSRRNAIVSRVHRHAVPLPMATGPGAVLELRSVLRKLGISRPILMTDAGVAEAGLVDRITGVLGSRGDAPIRIFADVRSNPSEDNVAAGVAAYRDAEADGIVALGGGSVIDAAKAVRLLVSHEG